MNPTRVGRHVPRVEHVALIVPAHAEVEQQPLDRRPVILEVCTDLIVVLLHERVAATEPELERNLEIVGLVPVSGVRRLREVELRHEIISLVDIVRVMVEAESALEHVLARHLETGERDIVAEAESLLDVLLNGGRRANHVVGAIDRVESPRVTKLVWAEAAVELREIDLRFVEPGSGEKVVSRL